MAWWGLSIAELIRRISFEGRDFLACFWRHFDSHRAWRRGFGAL
jgi:hypothetical protein